MRNLPDLEALLLVCQQTGKLTTFTLSIRKIIGS
jgi:hypothetical protein